MEKKSDRLTDKQELYCQYFVETLDKSESAKKAGFSSKRPGVLDVTVHRLSNNPKVIKRIAEIQGGLLKRIGLSQEYVLERLQRFADSNVLDYFKFTENSMSLKDLSLLPREITSCIQEIQGTKDGIKLKLVDKKGSVVDIGRHLGLFVDKKEITVRNIDDVLEELDD